MPASNIRAVYAIWPNAVGDEGLNPWFERAAKAGFDAVHLLAPFAAGPAGDPRHPVSRGELRPELARHVGAEAVPGVAALGEAARAQGLKLTLDFPLVWADAATPLLDERPRWFKRRHDGTPVPPVAPGGDPLDPKPLRGLVALDFEPDDAPEQAERFSAEAAGLLTAGGAAGLRFPLAGQAPPEFWRALVEAIRGRAPDAWLMADALDAPFARGLEVAQAGFDAAADSSAWWDLRAPWWPGQAAALRRACATVAFPEAPEGPRRSAHLEDGAAAEAMHRQRLLAAAFLGDVLLVPMGFEFGCRGLGAEASPEDWRAEGENPRFDLTPLLREALALDLPRGALVPASAPGASVYAALRLDAGSPAFAERAVALVADAGAGGGEASFPAGRALADAGGNFAGFAPVGGKRAEPIKPGEGLEVEAGSAALFEASPAPAATEMAAQDPPEGGFPAPPLDEDGEAALRALAENRVAVERVTPQLDGGRFAVKRVVGDVLRVEADVFADGHDKIAVALQARHESESGWREARMAFVDNDRWAGEAPLARVGTHLYRVVAWRDDFASWRDEVTKKRDAGVPIGLELEEGRSLVRRYAGNPAAEPEDKAALEALLAELEPTKDDHEAQFARLTGRAAAELMARADPRACLSSHGQPLRVRVDRPAAACAAWYELFPRSMSDDPNRHGTFDDVIRKLPYVRSLGFDVLYFPPIHPIGTTNRKGRNNAVRAEDGDVGSPYAIGSNEGGHDALHPRLGSFADFERLVKAAADHGLEIAIDYAINCSPDHPWIKDHPEWFDWRPDGTLKYAENPPKKYEDITNVAFYRESEPIVPLWREQARVILFWCSKGVKTFRVDNPHTKPYPFWEWLIAEVQARHPDAVFLAEAFTRPKVMKRLAKLGFTQSYSYFTWRERKTEIAEYLTELTRTDAAEHMRPNFFVNTPDINPRYLQATGRANFVARATLAATLSTVWGLYSGFELCEGRPLPGKEEYLDSEKYEIKAWDWERPGNIKAEVAALNRARRENPALRQFEDLEFLNAWDDAVLAYLKKDEATGNAVLVMVNLDPFGAREFGYELPLWRFGLGDGASLEATDLFSGHSFRLSGKFQRHRLDPGFNPVALWRLAPA